MPIFVTELGIIVVLLPHIKLLVSVSIIALQLSRESYFGFPLSTTIEFRLVQLKACSPIKVTELGMVIEVKPVQYRNAIAPIVVTELGIVTEVKPVQ